jgi:flagellar protein FliS
MISDPYRDHIQEAILSADPLELVAMLYTGLRDSINKARWAIHQGDIRGRAKAVSRGLEILVELSTSLDRERGGEIAARLSSLYAFLAECLQKANFQQEEGPLEQAEELVSTLASAWQELIEQRQSATSPVASRYELGDEVSTLSLCG